MFTEAPGTTDLVQHHIKLTSDEPVRSRPYPVPYSMRESLRKDIADMIKMGVIRESSFPYASPVVVVKKKDNTNRVCVDYQKLNKIAVFDPGPIPTHDSCDGQCLYRVTISRWKPSKDQRMLERIILVE